MPFNSHDNLPNIQKRHISCPLHVLALCGNVCSAPLSLPHLSCMRWRSPRLLGILGSPVYILGISAVIAIQGLVLSFCRRWDRIRPSLVHPAILNLSWIPDISLIFLSDVLDFLLYSSCIECRGYTRALARLPTNFISSRKSRTHVTFLHVQTRWAFFQMPLR